MQDFPWTCPYCNQVATVTQSNVSSTPHKFHLRNKEDMELWLVTSVIVCPSSTCREYSLDASLHRTRATGSGGRTAVEPPMLTWKLRPRSIAKPFPEYIPQPIREDYEEACLIAALSPKASATLSRRCLQGIIRDFWGIAKSRLIDEIEDLKDKIDAGTWEAIDAVRRIGNIGAHMEKDINLIVEVDSDEAELLVKLIEVLLLEWYVRRHDRDKHMKKIVSVAMAKTAQKS